MNGENIYLAIPNNAEYFSSVRLFLSGILSSKKLNIDDIEDIKMSVNEGLNIAHTLKCDDLINLEFEFIDNFLKIIISKICEKDIESMEELKLSTTIMECLLDDFYIQDESLVLKIDLGKNYE